MLHCKEWQNVELVCYVCLSVLKYTAVTGLLFMKCYVCELLENLARKLEF
jgi:hypothetical protein